MSELTGFTSGLPEVERAMVLAPHPDDESLGCGGTIALYSDKVHFTVVAVSDGEAVNIPEDNKDLLRKKEFEAALGTLGAHKHIFMSIPDGKFAEHGTALRTDLSGLFSDHRPQIVFAPAPIDMHPDHRETALACLDAARRFPGLQLAFYEIYNPMRFNVLIDIGPVIEAKRSALALYHYSMLKKENIFIASNLGINKSRSLFTLEDSYYEAFWMPPSLPSVSEIIKWYSNGLHVPPPEDRLLDDLRFAESLINEIRLWEEKGRESQKLVEQLTLELGRRQEIVTALRSHIDIVESGLFQRLARKYYRARDVMLPEGTSRKRLYEKLVGSIKKRPPQK